MKTIKLFLVMLFSIAISACGGSSGGSTSVPTSGTLSGTAATGKAIPSATITIKGANGVMVTSTTDTSGKYPATDVATLTAPYLLKVTTAAGTNLYSVATAGGTANIHPFTDLIIRNWYKAKNSNVEIEFSGTLTPANIPTPAEISTIKTVVSNILSTWLAKEGLIAFDLMSTPFNADGTGFDKVLDNTKVTIGTTGAGTVTVTTTDPTTGNVSTLVTTTIVTPNLVATDTTKPTDPTGLSASPASTTSILLAWTASTDNVGVAGYNIYRGTTKIGTSPYPSYSDTGLMSGTNYCYQVEAFDVAGNVSAKAPTMPVCAMPAAAADTTAPFAPTGLTAIAVSASQINLSWTASTDNVGVVGYDVYRGALKVATVNGTSYNDTGLSSSTAYSYTVKAKDAALNYSAASNTASATTSLGIPSAPTGVSATAATGQATISWTAVSGAASYNIYMATQVGVTKSNASTLAGGMTHTNVTSPFVHTSLINGTTYYFVVTAVNTAGESIESNQVSATPTAYSISGAVSGAIMSGVTITVTDAASSTVTTTTATNGSYSVAGLANGSYTVTPSLTGYTFSPTSTAVTIANGVNMTGINFTAAVYTAPTYTLSGTVTGPYVEGVTITMSGAGTGTRTTNASGAYSFANLPAGTYTLTPSLAGYTYSPAAPSVPVSANTTQNFTAASAIASYSISGTVTVSTTKTGLIYLRVYNTGCTGCNNTVAGTTIATTGGAYTIRGLQPGTYSVNAEMDTLNTGVKNAGNPVGNSATATITTANVSGVNVTVADITPPTPVTPTTGLMINPSSNAAFIFWDTPRDANGTEITSTYKIYWGTNTAATTGGGSVTVSAHNDGLYVQSGLTNGAVLYYKISALVGTTESAASTVIGPVTIGATTGLNTVSGTVSYTGTATGPMLVGVYNNGSVYFTSIASPVSGGSYSIAGVPNGSYNNFAVIDMNNNGIIDAGDISNTNGNAPTITVNGNTTSNLTLSSAGSIASVTTDHGFDGVTHWYDLNLQANDGTKRVMAVTLLSGKNMPVPRDLGKDWEFHTWFGLNATVPTVGDSYVFKVTYSDGATENISGSVTGVLGMGAMATSLAVSPTPSANVPTFTWAAPTTPPASYTYRVNLNGNANWWYPQDNGLPSTTHSAVYNADGRANPASLVTGTAYNWQVKVQDANRNSTSRTTTYTP